MYLYIHYYTYHVIPHPLGKVCVIGGGAVEGGDSEKESTRRRYHLGSGRVHFSSGPGHASCPARERRAVL